LQDDSESLAGTTPEQLSRLLYAGEYFDANAQMYYNRARWYNQNNGRFNRTDPFAGNMQDPQSLHKYLYAHANPTNGIDPSGLFNIPSIVTRMGITAILTGILNTGITGIGIYNLAKSDFVPSGIIFNLSFAAQGTSYGFAAAGTVSIFWHFSSQSLNLLFTPEAGISPISIFGTQRGLSVLPTAGFVFNADEATDVRGYNVTATWPWAMRKFVVPRTFRATPYYYAMMSFCNYLTGRWPGSKAAIQISQSGKGVVEFSGGRSYNFASTVGHTYMANLQQLPSKIRDAVQRVGNMFSSLNLKDAETPDKLIQISDHLISNFESE
jgi:RHS repeat-associated protein